jgi:alkylation response protein AidB-like acyl-CoA dehydrogenase
MEFVFTEEQAMIGETARAFFAESATSEHTRKAMAGDGIDRALWQSFCGELGLGGVALPEAYGGAGLGMVEFALVAEAAGAQVAAIPLVGSIAMAAHAIAAGGSDSQREEILPRLISGNLIGACAGTKMLTVDGNTLSGIVDFVAHGAAADLFVLGDAEGAWIVRRDAPGVTVTALTTMDQTRPFARLTLDRATAEPMSKGQLALQTARECGWVCLAAEALGGAQAALDKTVAYAKERIQFGRPIGSYWAACAVDEGSDEAALALHAAKSYCADTFFMCASNMIQLHGGIGFTWEHDAHLYFKRARSIQTMLGNGDYHREQVATMILGEAA